MGDRCVYVSSIGYITNTTKTFAIQQFRKCCAFGGEARADGGAKEMKDAYHNACVR